MRAWNTAFKTDWMADLASENDLIDMSYAITCTVGWLT
jgi:hypothetical protein